MTDESGENFTTELTPEEREALFFHHLNPIVAQAAAVQREREELNRLRKLAKADGFKLALIDEAMRMNDIEDDSIIVDEMKEWMQIAAWMGLPVGQQIDLFSEPDRTPLTDAAFAAGRTAGLLARDPKPPHEESTEAGQAWMRGWHEGQRMMGEDLKSAMEKKNAEKSASSGAGDTAGEEGAAPDNGDQADQSPADHAEAAPIAEFDETSEPETEPA